METSNLDHERLKMMNTGEMRKLSLKRILNLIVIATIVLILFLVVIAGGGYLWALSATDTSLAARGIIWGGSKYDDWKRFPSRGLSASDAPIAFVEEETDIFKNLPIDSKPLEAYLEETNTTAFIVLHENAILYKGYFTN